MLRWPESSDCRNESVVSQKDGKMRAMSFPLGNVGTRYHHQEWGHCYDLQITESSAGFISVFNFVHYDRQEVAQMVEGLNAL